MKNIIALLALGACTAFGSAQTDIIRNGHFEDLDGNGEMGDEWGRWGATGVYAFWVGIPHGVIWADLLDNNGGYFQLDIPGEAGANYTFRINNMRIEDNFNANLSMRIEFWSADAEISRVEQVIDSNEALGDVATGNGLSFEVSGVAPAGTVYARPVIAFDGSFPVETEQVNAFVFSVSLLTDAEPDPVEPTCPADFNNDGVANVSDLLSFLGQYRNGCPTE